MTTSTETKTRTKTAYLVFKQTNASGGRPTFQLVAKSVEAANAEAAVRAHADGIASAPAADSAEDARAGGTYVAVPARSWRPVTVKAETRTVLTLHDA